MYLRIRPADLLFSAALALTIVPIAASAETRSVRVHSYDLDLATPVGQSELQQRIHHAVEQVCGPATGARMDEIMSYQSCVRATQVNAMSQYVALVRAAHEGKVATGRGGDVIVR
jgi:UrcA family protein